MARLFGFIGNRPELGPLVLSAHAPQLISRHPTDGAVGWGVGFYQFGEVLLRRRPLESRSEVDLSKLTEGIRADALIGHVRHPTVGNLRTENTHPFRYRQWLFAQIGTVGSFERLRERLLELQPGFLRPNVRGDTDSELIFYLFLSCLHDLGNLDETSLPATAIERAMLGAFDLVDRQCDELGAPRLAGDTLLTNGEFLVGLHRTGNMAYRLINSSEQIHSLLPDGGPGSLGDASRSGTLEKARCCVVASEVEQLPEHWERAPKDHVLTASRTDGPQFKPAVVQ